MEHAKHVSERHPNPTVVAMASCNVCEFYTSQFKAVYEGMPLWFKVVTKVAALLRDPKQNNKKQYPSSILKDISHKGSKK